MSSTHHRSLRCRGSGAYIRLSGGIHISDLSIHSTHPFTSNIRFGLEGFDMPMHPPTREHVYPDILTVPTLTADGRQHLPVVLSIFSSNGMESPTDIDVFWTECENPVMRPGIDSYMWTPGGVAKGRKL